MLASATGRLRMSGISYLFRTIPRAPPSTTSIWEWGDWCEPTMTFPTGSCRDKMDLSQRLVAFESIVITYKQYYIDRFERGPNRWIARIRRVDGRNVRVISPASEHQFLETKPTSSAEEAESLAKQGIDFGGMV